MSELTKTTGNTSTGLAYEIEHLDDWSGTATVTWAEPHKARQFVQLPAGILASCGSSAMLRKAVSMLEKMK
jgi:hypothetical protein